MSEPCRLCGSTLSEPVSERDRHGGALRSIVCMGCGSVTNDPIPSDEELAAFYRSDYRVSYKGTAQPRMRQVWRNFGRMEQHLKANAGFYAGRSACLDLGSGSGEFMFMARTLGIGCVGIEPNQPYADYSREVLGLDVATQTLEETSFDAGSFDLIRLSHVMEHMRDPVRSLAVLRGWLADRGILYIEVPNILFDAAHKRRGAIFHYGHIFNFSPWTFRAAARRAGFEELPASFQRYGTTTSGFFAKGQAAEPGDVKSPANGERVRDALARHHVRMLPEPDNGSAIARGVRSVGARLSKIVAARRFSSPRQIADHFAARLERVG
ncbi:MAG: class I SAM-dependent methyltransferase [Rhizobiaceae bacterium]|nr:class I SAM-dependent methyltransferase [Rhizobiaceae bacterium]